jgi:signal transduction histidine kinase
MFKALARKERPVLSLMQRREKEDNLADCLLERNISNVEDIAENFVEFGFSDDDMRAFTELIPSQYLSPVLNWINNNLVTEKMVNDIQEASQRISELVSSVKNFTHMDKGHDKEYTDIHSGIRNTLTMLMHKIKTGNIELVEEYDTSLPAVKAYVGELNQVWTNIIDNALDAMEVNNRGVLRIKTERDREFVKVTVTDDGPGIPEELRSKIFDPFFTTKEIGKGTGLGLDVVMRIVKQHKGSLKVKSVPGETSFSVCFPIDG